ncbi:MAG: nitroreductase family protein [ANME-2 cluster archaeon]|jgi:5,6-dimethylbenzimidazole synthase|nr:nitroreductase family protein [ANME-2 cluster archaeon]
MEVYEAIQNRKSIRKFKSGPVPDETIIKILRAGTQAPNAFNKEQWEFILIKDRALQDELAQTRAKIPPQKIAMETAPLILVVCYNNELGMDAMGSAYACIQNILLAATAEGLGAVTLTSRGGKIKNMLNIPEGYDVAAIMPIGYSDEDPDKPLRIPVENKLHINRF